MTDPLRDLIGQHQARRRRDLAARHAADAAARFVESSTSPVMRAMRGLSPVDPLDDRWPTIDWQAEADRTTSALLELAGAVDEWEAAAARAPRHWTVRLGELVITGATQPAAAPFVDEAAVKVVVSGPGEPEQGYRLSGYALRLWRRPDHTRQALVIAHPSIRHTWLRLQRLKRPQFFHPDSDQRVGAWTTPDPRSPAAFARAAGGPRVLP